MKNSICRKCFKVAAICICGFSLISAHVNDVKPPPGHAMASILNGLTVVTSTSTTSGTGMTVVIDQITGERRKVDWRQERKGGVHIFDVGYIQES